MRRKPIRLLLVTVIVAMLLTGSSMAAEAADIFLNELTPIDQAVPVVTDWKHNPDGFLQPYGEPQVLDLAQYTDLSGVLQWSITEGDCSGISLESDGRLTVYTACPEGTVTVSVTNGTQTQSLPLRFLRSELYCWGGLISSQYEITIPQSGTVTRQCTVTIYDQYGGVVDPSLYQASWYLVTQDDWHTEYQNYQGITIDNSGLITVPAGAPACQLKIRVRLDKWESQSCQNGLSIVRGQAEASSEIASGFCGPVGSEESVRWSLDSEGLLKITGSGPMERSNNVMYRTPWHTYAGQIKKAIVGAGITELSSYAFYDCANLTEVVLNEGLLKIGNCAFSGCTSLQNIDLPDSVTEIGVDVFVNFPITQITLPNSLEVLQQEAFWCCTALKEIYLSEKITSIGRDAFYSAPLTDVYYAGSMAQWNAISIHPWNGNITHAVIHCKDGIATEGANVGGNADAFPGGMTLSMPQTQVDIPQSGAAAATLQPTVEIKDQYGQPHIPTSLTWSLYESFDGNSEGVTSLNGVTIDSSTGLITVSPDAVDCTIFVCAYAHTFIRDEQSGNGRGNGNAANCRLQIGKGGDIPGDAYLYSASIRMPTQTVSIPAAGEDAILLQPQLSVTDQNSNPYEGSYTPHWSLCTEIWGEDLTELNGVIIDPDTGLITISSGAQAGQIHVHVWVLDAQGNGTHNFKRLTLNPAHTHLPSDPVEENRQEATYLQQGSYDEVVYCSCGKELSRTPHILPALGPAITGQEVVGDPQTGYTLHARYDLHVLLAAYQQGKLVDMQVLQVAVPENTDASQLKFFLPEKQYDTLKLFYLTTVYQPIGTAGDLDL